LSFLVPENKNLFDTINDSLLVLCLDDSYKNTNKNTETSVGWNLFNGGGTKYNTANRWFDKTLQVN
jgi:retron-type reverse transcriptase